MAELKISFTLGERDLRHFRRELARAMGSVDRSKADQITAAAVSLIARARVGGTGAREDDERVALRRAAGRRLLAGQHVAVAAPLGARMYQGRPSVTAARMSERIEALSAAEAIVRCGVPRRIAISSMP